MRYFKILLLLLIILALFTSVCTNDSSKNNNPKVKAKVDTNKKSLQQKEIYLGEWVVTKILANARISALTTDEAKVYLHKKIYYSNKKVQFQKEIVKNPKFENSIVTDDEFFQSGYNYLTDIGISKKSVQLIEVSKSSGEPYWSEFGGAFYIKDENTLVIDYKGIYFEVIRLK